MKRFNLKCLLLLALVLTTQFACSMNDLPRNMSLKAFDPHRGSFTCKHEATAVPPIDPEAEAWLQQGLALTSQTLWPKERDYTKAVQLWQQAADRKHWKAMLNLASLYAHGEGVPKDTEHAVLIVEAAMKLGIPGAFDVMGTYHMEGRGVKQDASRAYAFWELAADMGSPSAQTYLGYALSAAYDDPSASIWDNRPVGLKMLECSFAQGHGGSALKLALIYERSKTKEDNARALHVLHEGTKFGSAEAAAALGLAFGAGKPMVNNVKDVNRDDRYLALSDALRRDPDLRLPNLDKVLPLPPARLPTWDGKRETLLNAAKAVMPVPPPPPKPAPNPASQRTGRAHIPEGFMLPEQAQVEVPAQYETTAAPVGGYWIARLMRHADERHIAWDETQVPMRYKKNELFDRSREGLRPEDGRIQFHYLGDPVAAKAQPTLLNEHPMVARGIARYGDVPVEASVCRGNKPCPQTGVWSASVPDDHPLSAVFNQWHRQAYVERGQPFPDPKAQHLDIEARAVTWQWRAQANGVRGGDWVYISVDELMAGALLKQAAGNDENGHAST